MLYYGELSTKTTIDMIYQKAPFFLDNKLNLKKVSVLDDFGLAVAFLPFNLYLIYTSGSEIGTASM